MDEDEVLTGEVLAGWTAGDTGALMLGAVTSGDGTLHSDEACSSAGAAVPEELVVSLTPEVVHHRTRWQAGSVAKEMAAAGAKAVISIRRFVEFAFFFGKTAARLLGRIASL